MVISNARIGYIIGVVVAILVLVLAPARVPLFFTVSGIAFFIGAVLASLLAP